MADNPSAFPSRVDEPIPGGGCYRNDRPGMSLRDWFAGQALASGLVKPTYPEWQLRAWFGDRCGISGDEIAARAAYVLADAMLKQREKSV